MKKIILSALFACGLVAGIEAAPEDPVTQADLQAIFERLASLEAANKAQAERIAELENQNRELAAAHEASMQDLVSRQELAAVQEQSQRDIAAVKEEGKRDVAAAQEANKQDLAAAQEFNMRELAAAREEEKRDIAATEEAYKRDIAEATTLKWDETTETNDTGRVFTTETGKKYYLADATARIFEPLSESGLQITPYGYLVFEGIYNTHGTESDYYSDYVRPNQHSGNGHQTTLSMQDSILGVQFDTPEATSGWKFTGRAEFDLAGDNAKDYAFHWRHLYVDAQHESGWSILFGQYWHLWKMVSPSEIDGAWMEQTGHPYRRSPQLRVTKKWDIDEDSSIEIRTGIVKNGTGMGEDIDGDGNLDDVASAWPLFEGAVIYDRKAAWEDTGRRWSLGLAGMYGRERLHRWTSYNAVTDKDYFNGELDEYDSKMVMVATSVPFLDKFTFTGQLFSGDNLDGIQAGVGQGIAFSKTTPNEIGREVSTVGGFFDLGYELNDTWSFAAGYGFDDPTDSTARHANGICLNDRAYFDVFYRITPNFKLGFEYAVLRTKYNDGVKDGQPGTARSNRFQFAALYDF